MKINFLDETMNKLEKFGYTKDDIDWIGARNFQIPIKEFFTVARNTDYNNGYGIVQIPGDLVIVMKDGSWFSREEYDGSEWWKFNVKPSKFNLIYHLKVNSFTEIDDNWKPRLIKGCWS